MSSRDIGLQEKRGSCKESPEETKNKINLILFIFFKVEVAICWWHYLEFPPIKATCHSGYKPETPTFPVRLEQAVFQGLTSWRMAGEEVKQTWEIFFIYIPALRLVCLNMEAFFNMLLSVEKGKYWRVPSFWKVFTFFILWGKLFVDWMILKVLEHSASINSRIFITRHWWDKPPPYMI